MPDDFSLTAASEGAIAHLDSTLSDAPAPVTPEAPAPTDTGTPAASTPTPAAAAAIARMWKVKVDGEELDVPEDELVSGYSRTAKFTKEMMNLAEQRKQFDAERNSAVAREQQLNDFFRDPSNIARYYEHLTGKPITPAQAAAIQAATPQQPDEFATVQGVERAAQEQAARLQAQLQQQVAQQLADTQRWTTGQIEKARIEANQERKANEYHGEINSTVSSLLEQYPDLKAIDNIEEVLCLDAQRMGPNSIEEAKAALLNVAKGRAERITAHFKQMQKASAIERTKLQTNGIEPPGGSGPVPTPTTFKLGSKELSAAAAEWMDKSNKKK